MRAINSPIMGVKNHVKTVVTHTVRCILCEQYDFVISGTATNAAREFMTRGWVASKGTLFCPICASNNK